MNRRLDDSLPQIRVLVVHVVVFIHGSIFFLAKPIVQNHIVVLLAVKCYVILHKRSCSQKSCLLEGILFSFWLPLFLVLVLTQNSA